MKLRKVDCSMNTEMLTIEQLTQNSQSNLTIINQGQDGLLEVLLQWLKFGFATLTQSKDGKM
jgi:hypothetical protein